MKYVIPFFGLLILLQFCSCKKDFLDNVNDKSVLIRQDYVVDLKTTGDYLTGIYTLLGSDLYSYGSAFVYPELVADNIKPVQGSGGTTPSIFIYSWSQVVNNSSSTMFATAQNANGLSYTLYKIISSSNFVIESTDKFRNENPSKADNLRGQSLFLRAFAHFALVNTFAQQYNFTANGSHPGVVYVKTSNWTKLPGTRNTVAEVYANLIEDLKMAIDLLPSGRPSTLTVSQTAAKALLARIYLSQGNYSSAKNIATAVAREVPIMNVNYPAKLFTPEESEALFQIAPTDFSTNDYSTQFPGYYFKTNIQYRPTDDIVSLLNEDANDKRKAWITYIPPVAPATVGNWNITKYPENIVPGFYFATGSHYLTLLRSSEMYLIAAEAYANINRPDSAIYFLDEIKKRSNPSMQATVGSGNILLEAIYKERRKELAFEGFRMFDLLRWKKPVVRQDVLSPASKELPYPSDKAIAPIPGLDISKIGLKQNSGY